MNSIARCHLRMGNWSDAMKAAEIVMSKDRKNTNAIQIKAEGLYNSCFFEHALVLFHRGQVLTKKDILKKILASKVEIQPGSPG